MEIICDQQLVGGRTLRAATLGAIELGPANIDCGRDGGVPAKPVHAGGRSDAVLDRGKTRGGGRAEWAASAGGGRRRGLRGGSYPAGNVPPRTRGRDFARQRHRRRVAGRRNAMDSQSERRTNLAASTASPKVSVVAANPIRPRGSKQVDGNAVLER